MHPVEVLLVPLGRIFRNRHADASASIANAAAFATDAHFALSSPAFADGQEIPAKYCGPLIGRNISPAFEWGALPAQTTHLLFVMEDLNSPGALPHIHTIAEFPASQANLPEGALVPDAPGFSFLPRAGRPGRYVGPRPLPGHGPHLYRFHLYALDAQVDLAEIAKPDKLPAAVAGHVLASGTLTSTRTS